MYLLVHNENEALTGRLFIGKPFVCCLLLLVFLYFGQNIRMCLNWCNIITLFLKDVELILQSINEEYELLLIYNILILITLVPWNASGVSNKIKGFDFFPRYDLFVRGHFHSYYVVHKFILMYKYL